MTRELTIAVLQSSFGEEIGANIDRISGLIRAAALKGAQVILPPELFQGPYFCKTQQEDHFAVAAPWSQHRAVLAMSDLARELGVVIPVSIFEKEGPHYFNSMVMVDADGLRDYGLRLEEGRVAA